MQLRNLLTLALLASTTAISGPAQTHEEPETVMVTYHPKAGSESQMLAAIKRDWETLTRLRLVEATPHLVVKGKDDSGATAYTEVFTWVSGDTPDHVPAEVQSIWDSMGGLVEQKKGQPGIDFRTVSVVDGK